MHLKYRRDVRLAEYLRQVVIRDTGTCIKIYSTTIAKSIYFRISLRGRTAPSLDSIGVRNQRGFHDTIKHQS